MEYEELMENVVKAFEVAGVAILAIGSIVIVMMMSAMRTSSPSRIDRPTP